MNYNDTIAAIATPPGEGGIGIVRLSGEDAVAIAQRIFHPRNPGRLRSHRLRYGHIIEPDTGDVIDEALLTLMRAPHSFTREDVVELSCHGGRMPIQRTLEVALVAGARLAEAGEFTLRAFLNGRIDLTQAEATLDVVQAQTATGLALAQAQLGGWLAQEVRRIRANLLELLAYVTVMLDFPEDEVEPEERTSDLLASLHAVERLLASSNQGIIYRLGARAALVGRPNVGKSSLLNLLLRADRAIVTAVPGTTRDTLEETANLAGIPVVLIDTAGITESSDPVERLGVERSRTALAGADLALLVLDSSKPCSDEDRQIATLTYAKPTALVWNKTDLHHPPATLPFDHPNLIATVATSVVTGTGIDELVSAIAHTLLGGTLPSEMHLVTNPRHHDALSRTAVHLRAARDIPAALGYDHEKNGGLYPTDLLAGELTSALNALGEITGETVGDDLLDTIFSRFCIGK